MWLGPLKDLVKRRRKARRHAYAAKFHAFTPEDRHIAAIGVRRGDALLVHSAFHTFAGFTGNEIQPTALLR